MGRVLKPRLWWPGINRHHPLARGLVFCCPMLEGAGTRLFDVAAARYGILTSMDPATDWVGGPYGHALDFDGSDDYVAVSGSPFSGLTQATWLVHGYHYTSGGSQYGQWFGSNTGWNAGFNISRDAADVNYVQGVVSNVKVNPTITWVLNEWWVCVVTYQGGKHLRIYRDGLLVGENTTSIPASVPAHTGIEIGQNTTSGLPAHCQLSLCCGWDYAMPSAIVRLVSAEPYAMLRPPSAMRFGDLGTAPGGAMPMVMSSYR